MRPAPTRQQGLWRQENIRTLLGVGPFLCPSEWLIPTVGHLFDPFGPLGEAPLPGTVADRHPVLAHVRKIKGTGLVVFQIADELIEYPSWAAASGEYRATVADRYGHTEIMRGRLDGDLMVFESMRDIPPLLKMTWDTSSPGYPTWRNEMTFDGENWQLIEEYRMVPIA